MTFEINPSLPSVLMALGALDDDVALEFQHLIGHAEELWALHGPRYRQLLHELSRRMTPYRRHLAAAAGARPEWLDLPKVAYTDPMVMLDNGDYQVRFRGYLEIYCLHCEHSLSNVDTETLADIFRAYERRTARDKRRAISRWELEGAAVFLVGVLPWALFSVLFCSLAIIVCALLVVDAATVPCPCTLEMPDPSRAEEHTD
jgi:hypothetical protein